MHKPAISNTTPLYYMYNIGLFEILQKRYGEIIIPEAVVEELQKGKEFNLSIPEVKKIDWIKIKKVKVPNYIKMIPDLGKGEAEVIALASEYDNPILLLDDAIGREIALLQRCNITGTLGIIIKAKKIGLLKSVRPHFEKLKAAGFYISEKLYNDILNLANE